MSCRKLSRIIQLKVPLFIVISTPCLPSHSFFSILLLQFIPPHLHFEARCHCQVDPALPSRPRDERDAHYISPVHAEGIYDILSPTASSAHLPNPSTMSRPSPLPSIHPLPSPLKLPNEQFFSFFLQIFANHYHHCSHSGCHLSKQNRRGTATEERQMDRGRVK